MRLEVKYLFPISSSGANFYIYQLPEGLRMRKILGCKRIHKPRWRFSVFSRILMTFFITPLNKNFINGVANREIVH